jgi:three-Cys-motif partner protein
MGKHKHAFGGEWTKLKLDMVRKYLQFYVTALSKQKFTLVYLDAFAGTGYLDRLDDEDQRLLDLPQLRGSLAGSAQNALRTKPPFHRYMFVDRDRKHYAELRQMVQNSFPGLSSRVTVHCGDANSLLPEYCASMGTKERAVLFLDPYGLQVRWDTVHTIASTQRIDMWYLFPLGIAVNRLLRKDAQVRESERAKLDTLLGESGWYDTFYKAFKQTNLFGETETVFEKCSVASIARYFCNRLKTVFPGVAESYRLLYNSKNNPLFVLYFAMGNPAFKAQNLALKAASSILED